MNSLLKAAVSGLVCMAGFAMMSSAHAVPAFASKYEKKCSYCHNAWPQLNEKGRAFKEHGYRMKEDLKEGAEVSFRDSGSFPISALIVARPYDNEEETQHIRAIHEVELFVAGSMGQNLSMWTEIEAEDETDFAPEVGGTSLAWRFNDAANVQLNHTPANWADGYGLLGDHFRLTSTHVGVISTPFGDAEAGSGLRASRQNIALTGRVVDNKLFYNVAYGGVADNPEGIEDTAVNARAAYDLRDNVMIGGFIMNGTASDAGASEELSFNRAGVDTQIDLGNTRVQAAYVMATDDQLGGGSHDNNAYSVQAYHVFKTEKGSPTWVPLARLDSYTVNDGEDEFTELTLNLTHYLAENVKAYIEYWNQISVPSGVDEEDRLMLHVNVGL